MPLEMIALMLVVQASPTMAAFDTLTYREVSESQIQISSPQGEAIVETFHDATIGFVAFAPDSAHAWYEALQIAASGPQGEVRPATEAVLGLDFVLRLDDRMHVETVEAPDFPEAFQGITDLTKQFHDFFMPEPAESLALGVLWTDTFTSVDTAQDGRVTHSEKRGRYEVVRDSLIEGDAVWVVHAEVDQEMRSQGPGPQPGITAVSTLDGSDTGEFLISKDRADMVARSRTGRLSGELRYEGMPQPIILPQVIEYTNSVELLERDGR